MKTRGIHCSVFYKGTKQRWTSVLRNISDDSDSCDEEDYFLKKLPPICIPPTPPDLCNNSSEDSLNFGDETSETTNCVENVLASSSFTVQDEEEGSNSIIRESMSPEQVENGTKEKCIKAHSSVNEHKIVQKIKSNKRSAKENVSPEQANQREEIKGQSTSPKSGKTMEHKKSDPKGSMSPEDAGNTNIKYAAAQKGNSTTIQNYENKKTALSPQSSDAWSSDDDMPLPEILSKESNSQCKNSEQAGEKPLNKERVLEKSDQVTERTQHKNRVLMMKSLVQNSTSQKANPSSSLQKPALIKTDNKSLLEKKRSEKQKNCKSEMSKDAEKNLPDKEVVPVKKKIQEIKAVPVTKTIQRKEVVTKKRKTQKETVNVEKKIQRNESDLMNSAIEIKAIRKRSKSSKKEEKKNDSSSDDDNIPLVQFRSKIEQTVLPSNSCDKPSKYSAANGIQVASNLADKNKKRALAIEKTQTCDGDIPSTQKKKTASSKNSTEQCLKSKNARQSSPKGPKRMKIHLFSNTSKKNKVDNQTRLTEGNTSRVSKLSQSPRKEDSRAERSKEKSLSSDGPSSNNLNCTKRVVEEREKVSHSLVSKPSLSLHADEAVASSEFLRRTTDSPQPPKDLTMTFSSSSGQSLGEGQPVDIDHPVSDVNNSNKENCLIREENVPFSLPLEKFPDASQHPSIPHVCSTKRKPECEVPVDNSKKTKHLAGNEMNGLINSSETIDLNESSKSHMRDPLEKHIAADVNCFIDFFDKTIEDMISANDVSENDNNHADSTLDDSSTGTEISSQIVLEQRALKVLTGKPNGKEETLAKENKSCSPPTVPASNQHEDTDNETPCGRRSCLRQRRLVNFRIRSSDSEESISDDNDPTFDPRSCLSPEPEFPDLTKEKKKKCSKSQANETSNVPKKKVYRKIKFPASSHSRHTDHLNSERPQMSNDDTEKMQSETEDSDLDEVSANIIVPMEQDIMPENNSNVEPEEALVFEWEHKDMEENVFTRITPEATGQPKPAVEYFKHFFDDNFIEQIKEYTNLNSQEKNDGISMNITKQEINIFIGIWIFMGVLKLPSYTDYWSRTTRVPQVADHMSLKRFEKIRSYLFFADRKNYPASDRFWKVRPLLSHIKEKCRSLKQTDTDFSVDESMVPYKGKYAGNLRQYIASKPHKWGFKFYVLAGVSGKVYDFFPYSGSNTFDDQNLTDEESKNFTIAPKNVLALAKTISNPRICTLMFDNFFTTLPLLVYLKNKLNLLSTGTIRPNRIKNSPLISDADLIKKGRGAFDVAVCKKNDVALIKWYDNKVVNVASTIAGATPLTTVSRWNKKESSKSEVPCPRAVSLYNKSMGGVDLFDMLCEIYRMPSRGKRWYLPLCGYMINIALVNSWLLYRDDQPDEKLQLSSKEFRVRIYEGLVAKPKKRGRPSAEDIIFGKKVSRSPVTPTPDVTVRMDNIGHWAEWAEKKGRCRVCVTETTKVKCKKCNVHLCFVPTRNCFFKFHNGNVKDSDTEEDNGDGSGEDVEEAL